MRIKVRSLCIDEDASYTPYRGYTIDVDVESFEDISDVIDQIGEDELLYEIGSNKISELVSVDDFLNTHKVEDIVSNMESVFLDAILSKINPSELLDHVSDEDILSKAREININKI